MSEPGCGVLPTGIVPTKGGGGVCLLRGLCRLRCVPTSALCLLRDMPTSGGMPTSSGVYLLGGAPTSGGVCLLGGCTTSVGGCLATGWLPTRGSAYFQESALDTPQDRPWDGPWDQKQEVTSYIPLPVNRMTDACENITFPCGR